MILAQVLGLDVLVIMTIVGLSCAIPVWAIIDASYRNSKAFHDADLSKSAWIIILVIATVFGLGAFLGGYYLLITRRQL
jgi:hypothetical protein